MTLLVIIDPVGSVPVFLFATAAVPAKLHRRFAVRTVGVAMLVLLLFLVAGQFLLESLGRRLGSFQIAGGIVLFLFPLTTIFGDSKPAREIEGVGRDHLAGGSAIPSIASPGAMLAVVILTDNHRNSSADQALTAFLLLLVMALTLALLLAASQTRRLIGPTGASVVSRVMESSRRRSRRRGTGRPRDPRYPRHRRDRAGTPLGGLTAPGFSRRPLVAAR